MLAILADAVIFMAVLKIVNNEEVEFLTSLIVAFVAAIVANLLVIGLATLMGVAGAILGLIIVGVLLGIAVSAMFGTEIKRSFLAGGLFILVHFAVSIGFQQMLGS
ncbi:MAG: hypothetical protein R6U98_15630 [Pirellulaceae bacterium]